MIQKNVFVFIWFLILGLLWSCASTNQEVISPEKKTASVVKKPKVRLTSCTTLSDLDPKLKSDTEDAFTLYRDQIIFKNYREARKLWKLAYYTAPGADGKVTYHFDDGIKIYHNIFLNDSEPAQNQGLVDTILSIYDKRMECFDDDGTILARKAFNSYYSYSKYTNADQTFNDFREVIRRKGKKADYFIVNPFTKMLYDRLLDEKIDREEGKRLVQQIFNIIEYGKTNCKGEYCKAWQVIDEYSPELLSGLEGFRGFYDCDYYLDKYFHLFLDDPSNCDNISEIYLKMVWANCDVNHPKFIALKTAKERECYVPPPPPGPLKQAYTLLEAGEFREAILKFDEYVAKTDDPEKKAEKLLIISKIYYAHIKNFPSARHYALEAANYKPNWGEPYLLIGKLYASSGPLCGPGRGWDSQVVTWAAIDKFSYAKKIDPSVTEEANKWISRYSQYMPDKEDVFTRLKKVGDPYFVPCWIKENTRIRTSD